MNFNTRKYLISSVTIAILIQTIHGSHILTLFPFGSKSHMIYYEPLITSYASRGHHVTVFAPFEIYDKNSNPNVTQIVPAGLIESASSNYIDVLNLRRTKTAHHLQFLMPAIGKSVCDFFLQTKELKDLLDGKSSYDVVLLGNIFNECALPVVHKLNVPYIAVTSAGLVPWLDNAVWNPQPWSYVPNLYLSYSDHMDFWERFYNAIFSIVSLKWREWTYLPALDDIVQRHLGPGMPPIVQMERNASLLFMNSDPSVDYPRPNLPSIIGLGAIHCKPPNTLPRDLQQFLDDSGKDGFVIFSLGSVLPEVKFPQEILEEFVKAFSRIPQRVIWNWKAAPPTGLTPNVKLVKWFPQQDLLGHPKIRAFITHGGLLSTQEGIYHGVPMLGLPVFADQDWNVRRSVVEGTAIELEIGKITADEIVQSLEKLMNDPSYKINIGIRQRILKDKPVDPVELGVYWTEYVIRHRGAHHLRTAALNLTWFQVYLLDVAAVALIAALLACFVAWKTLKLTVKYLIKTEKSKRD